MQLRISKLDAALRQIETAITLYFHESDPVSIHTLAAAGYNLVRDINAKRKGSEMLAKDFLVSIVQKDQMGVVRKKLNEAENFFKHADRDPDNDLLFNAQQTEFFLLDACTKYRELTSEFPPLLSVFQCWLMVQYPDLFKSPPELDAVRSGFKVLHCTTGRQEFFTKMMALASQVPLSLGAKSG